MERQYSNKPLLPFLLALCCLLLLLPLASSAPMSRSLRLRSQPHPPSPKLVTSTFFQDMTAANLGGRAARVAVEVNDYPGSGANNRHDPPKGPGRA